MSDDGAPVVLWLHERTLREEGSALSMRVFALPEWLQLVHDGGMTALPYPGAPRHLDTEYGPLLAVRVEQAGQGSWAFGIPPAAVPGLADVMTPADHAALRRIAGLPPVGRIGENSGR